MENRLLRALCIHYTVHTKHGVFKFGIISHRNHVDVLLSFIPEKYVLGIESIEKIFVWIYFHENLLYFLYKKSSYITI